ncbi:MAG: methyltransferase domain-containing protein [Ktedonobacteraceae bacterium]|nr:methyltransferase domain-containing protein [Ktedonobacteraceae bacterium]
MTLNSLLRPKTKSPKPSAEQSTPLSQPIVVFDEDNRRHRADVPYLLPKDRQEAKRLDYQHYLFRRVLQGNCFAPVHDLLQSGATVLDVGCGTGRWGYEIATKYPQAQVINFDLEPVPCTGSTPLNAQFVQGNLFHGLPFPQQHFQYVHQRLLVAAIPLMNWPWVIAELKRITTLNGWIELVEMGNSLQSAGPATEQFLSWWMAISASGGIDASTVSELDVLLTQANLTPVQKKVITLPVGAWGGSLGKMLAQNLLAGWPSMRPLTHELLGIAPNHFDTVIEQLSDEWNAFHTTYDMYFYCVQVAEPALHTAYDRSERMVP